MTDLRNPFGLGMDLDTFMERGATGLGFAFFGDAATYHAGTDTPMQLSLGSLQQDGGDALALARTFGNRDLRPNRLTGQNAVFFTVAGGLVAHYPGALVVPLALVVTLLFGAVLVVGLRRRRFSVGGLAFGAGMAFVSLLGTVILISIAWWLIRRQNTELHVVQVGSYQAEFFLAGLVALTLAFCTALTLGLRRWVSSQNLSAGALTWWIVLLWLTALALPGFSYLLAWPLLAALLPLVRSVLWPTHAARLWARLLGGAMLLGVAVLLLAPAVYVLSVLASRAECVLGVPVLGVPMLVVALGAGLAVPPIVQIPGRRRWLVPATAALASAVLLGAGITRTGFSNRQPQPNLVAYRLNADTGTAVWLTANDSRWSGDRAGALDPWTRQFIPAGSQKTRLALFPSELPTTQFLAYQAPAPIAALPPPEATLLADTTDAGRRTFRLRVTSPRHALNAQLTIHAGGRIAAMAVNDKPVDLSGVPVATRNELTLQYYGLPIDGFELRLTIQSTEPLTLSLADRSYGLPTIPGFTVSPRPASMTTAMTEITDSTTVTRDLTFPR